MELTLSDAIADYIEQRKQVKLEPLQKTRDKLFENSDDLTQRSIATAQYHEAAAPIEAAFNPVDWLTDAAKRAKQISLATHAPKYTNADAKSSSIKVLIKEDSNRYLTTASLSNPIYDYVGNAAALDIVGLLKVTVNDESLLDQLFNGHVAALSKFTNDKANLDNWLNGFLLVLEDKKRTSHNLSKQVYYPINGDNFYHLICPLYSSSLAHELYLSVNDTKYGESIEIRKVRNNELYSPKLDVRYPKILKQTFGATKNARRNFSRFNIDRDGVGYLLNSAPPTYKAQSKPPLTSQSVFNREFSFKTAGLIREFKAFLAGLTAQDRNFKTRYKRDYSFVLPLIDSLFNHAVQIQNLTEHAGWSNDQDCQMKRQHALWLDVNNPNQGFQAERDKGDWLEVVAHDFSLWLLRKLENKQQYLLGDVEQKYFKKLCLHELKSFEQHTPKLGEH
jgi:CRISPR-associated protein Csy1